MKKDSMTKSDYEKQKKKDMEDGFDRWTSNGIGQVWDDKPLTEEQKKIIEEANRELERKNNKKDKEIIYVEPKEYFSEEARKIFENADRSKTLLSWLVNNKKYYIHDTGCDSLLDFIEIREEDAYIVDGPRVKTYKIYLTNEYKRVYEVTISKKECEKLVKLDEDELLKLASEIINTKKPEINKPIIKLIQKD